MPEPESGQGFAFVDRRRRGEEPVPGPPPAAPSLDAPPARPEAPRPASGRPSADLASLCVMFYGDALVSLGQVADPVTGERHRDLEQAQFLIDLLGMLREKTASNRTAEESAVLDEVLATLRMAFVRASR